MKSKQLFEVNNGKDRAVPSLVFVVELMEETGIQATDVDVDPNFRFEEVSVLWHPSDPRALPVSLTIALDLLSSLRAIWRRTSEEDTCHLFRPTSIGFDSG